LFYEKIAFIGSLVAVSWPRAQFAIDELEGTGSVGPRGPQTRRSFVRAHDTLLKKNFSDGEFALTFSGSVCMFATEVDIEKKSIYEPCLPYLSQKYNVPLKQWSVIIGLLFDSRGSISKFTWNYLKELHIPFDYVMFVLINIIKDSLQILHHLYFN
ncbi:hypothetical protein ANN_26073, partial [Periplaneta americana]